jgi:hypothetical protein
LALWEERFGINASEFDGYELLATSRTVYIRRGTDAKPEYGSLQMAGMPFVREVGRFLKPVTCAVQRFGHLASKNVADLSCQALKTICSDGEITMSGFDTGFVIVKTGCHVWGACLFVEPDRLLCRLPKGIRRAVTTAAINGLLRL